MISGFEGKVAVVTGPRAVSGPPRHYGCRDAAYMTGEVVSVDGGSSIVSTVRPSGGAGAWDFGALDERTYGREE